MQTDLGRQPVKKSRSLIRLAKFLRPFLGQLLFCVVCVIVSNVAELMKPYVAKIIIDDFLTGGKPQSGIWSITGLGISYFIITLFGALALMIQARVVARMGQRVLHEMRSRLLSHILRMPVYLLDKYGSGRLLTRATNDVETINEFYSDVLVNLFRDIFLLTGIIVVMLQMDTRLALISFTGIPLILLVTLSVKKVLRKNFISMKSIIGRINGFFAESIAGMRIIQVFNREKNKLGEFDELNDAYFKTTMTQVIFNSILRPVMEIINNLVIALLIAYAYDRVMGGVLEIGVIYAFTTYVKQFFGPINDLAEKYTTVQSAAVSGERIFELLDEDESEDPYDGTYAGPVKGEVEFKDVWFAYNGEDWVLKGVSFKVDIGQKAAFVGSTGAGKTTIINLIGRYYTPQMGKIYIDGVPITDWQLEPLRRGISIVLQDVFLFTGDIYQNIDLGSTLTKEQVDQAIEAACAKEFVEEMGGLSSHVTEQGLNISTGQRQLISFARAVAAQPSILVLDEATAHIDTETENVIKQSISRISEGRTALFIAHRLSTIRSCDVIFVLNHGVIVEQGNHEELMQKNGAYASLVKEEAGLSALL